MPERDKRARHHEQTRGLVSTALSRLVNSSDNIASQVQSESTYKASMFLRAISEFYV